MTAILNLAVALLAGLLMTRIFSRWHLPDVTAFLVTGVLIGPFVLGRLGIPGLGFASYDQVEALSMISDVAMGFIAFSIGNEFRLSQLKKTGKQAMIIGVLQALAALAFVDVALVIFHFLRPDVLSVPAAITLGAIATATAPATTLMVVRQYKAKGELTDLLLPIVALDDAVGLIAFAVSFGIARAMDSAQFSLASILLSPLIELVGSLLLGALAGDLDHLGELAHELGRGMEATGGIDEDQIASQAVSLVQHVVAHAGRIASTLALDHGHAGALAPNIELLDGGGAERIGATDHNLLSTVRHVAGDLSHRGGLASPVDAYKQHAAGGIAEDVAIGLHEHLGQTVRQRAAQLTGGLEIAPRGLVAQVVGDLHGDLGSHVAHDEGVLEVLPEVLIDLAAKVENLV